MAAGDHGFPIRCHEHGSDDVRVSVGSGEAIQAFVAVPVMEGRRAALSIERDRSAIRRKRARVVLLPIPVLGKASTFCSKAIATSQMDSMPDWSMVTSVSLNRQDSAPFAVHHHRRCSTVEESFRQHAGLTRT